MAARLEARFDEEVELLVAEWTEQVDHLPGKVTKFVFACGMLCRVALARRADLARATLQDRSAHVLSALSAAAMGVLTKTLSAAWATATSVLTAVTAAWAMVTDALARVASTLAGAAVSATARARISVIRLTGTLLVVVAASLAPASAASTTSRFWVDKPGDGDDPWR